MAIGFELQQHGLRVLVKFPKQNSAFDYVPNHFASGLKAQDFYDNVEEPWYRAMV